MLKKAKDNTARLDEAIEELENAIIGDDIDTEKYHQKVSTLETLYKLRNGKSLRGSTELKDWIPVIGSLGGIMLIVTFEAFGHTLTSKSLAFTSKLKS